MCKVISISMYRFMFLYKNEFPVFLYLQIQKLLPPPRQLSSRRHRPRLGRGPSCPGAPTGEAGDDGEAPRLPQGCARASAAPR